MARTATEVLVGTGTLYVAPVGEAYPANPITAVAGNWADIGYSEDGWTFEVDRTFEDIEVAEEVDPLAVFKTAQSIRLTGAAAQGSLVNLQLAMGGGTITVDSPSAGYDTYTPPASDVYTAKALLLRVNADLDGTKARDIQIPKAVSTGAISMPFGKAPAKSTLAMDWRVLVPSAGSIFSVIEEQ